VSRHPIQVGLVSPGPVRDAFRRWLELSSEVDPDLAIREEPFRIVIDHAGSPLLTCRPRATSVLIAAGDREALVCRAPQEFAAALAELLRLIRARLAAGAPASATASSAAPPGAPPTSAMRSGAAAGSEPGDAATLARP